MSLSGDTLNLKILCIKVPIKWTWMSINTKLLFIYYNKKIQKKPKQKQKKTTVYLLSTDLNHIQSQQFFGIFCIYMSFLTTFLKNPSSIAPSTRWKTASFLLLCWDLNSKVTLFPDDLSNQQIIGLLVM